MLEIQQCLIYFKYFSPDSSCHHTLQSVFAVRDITHFLCVSNQEQHKELNKWSEGTKTVTHGVRLAASDGKRHRAPALPVRIKTLVSWWNQIFTSVEKLTDRSWQNNVVFCCNSTLNGNLTFKQVTCQSNLFFGFRWSVLLKIKKELDI